MADHIANRHAEIAAGRQRFDQPGDRATFEAAFAERWAQIEERDRKVFEQFPPFSLHHAIAVRVLEDVSLSAQEAIDKIVALADADNGDATDENDADD